MSIEERKIEDIRMAKAEMVAEYKEVILNNFQTVCYPLFTILNSEKELEKCDGYTKIVGLPKNGSTNSDSYKDELYVLRTLASYLDKTPIMGSEREEAKKMVLGYSNYFNNKSKVAS